MPFKKGYKPTKKHLKNLSKSLKGRNAWNKGLKGFSKDFFRTKEWNKKISEGRKKSLKAITASKKNAEKMGKNNIGKKHTEETKEKHRKLMIGKNNPLWAGGVSFYPYPKEFNSALKLKIRTRDNFTCCLCSRTEREELEELNRVLAVNHIDFNKDNCKENNLNTLCLRCNTKINREREYWTNYFNNLYE